MMNILRKIYYKTLGRSALLDRIFRYNKPHDYWKKRGGEQYFSEQEAVQSRTLRSEFLAKEIRKYDLNSFVEIGCGYGKQLKNIYREYDSNLKFAGCDFSGPQLEKGYEYFPEMKGRVVEADAEAIPFDNKSYEMAFSSAVILHNDYKKAQKIISEMIRVSTRYIAHNEDTDVTFSRYGYDLKKTYEALGFKVLDSKQIPCANEPEITQFTVVELPDSETLVAPENIPLQYHESGIKV